MFLAERQGFEPRVPRSTTVFKTAAIDHSATSPKLLFNSAFLLKRCKGTNHFLICKFFRKNIWKESRLFHLTTAFLPCPPPQNLPFAHSDAEAALRCFFFKKESDRLLPEKCSRLTIVIQLFIPARIPRLMSPHARADEPAYPGR